MDKEQSISLPVIVEIDEDNFFIVSCPVFRGCHSYGKTIDDAMKNLSEVIEICLEEVNYKVDNLNKYIGMREITFSKSRLKKLDYA